MGYCLHWRRGLELKRQQPLALLFPLTLSQIPSFTFKPTLSQIYTSGVDHTLYKWRGWGTVCTGGGVWSRKGSIHFLFYFLFHFSEILSFTFRSTLSQMYTSGVDHTLYKQRRWGTVCTEGGAWKRQVENTGLHVSILCELPCL